MANPEHVKILNQGVEVWNKWRLENPNEKPNLEEADLRQEGLRYADLNEALLQRANLSGADLAKANLKRANLSSAILVGTQLNMADLSEADLSNAKLTEAVLIQTNLIRANLTEASLIKANLDMTDLSGANLSKAHLNQAILICTILTDSNLFKANDEDFAKRLHADLRAKNVNCWYAPEDMKIGDKFRSRIDEMIHIHDKLLLVLSKDSVESSWVEKEVETAFEKEDTRKETVLFPIRLDDEIMDISSGWPADISKEPAI